MATYATTVYQNTAPASYAATTMEADLTTAFATDVSIPISFIRGLRLLVLWLVVCDPFKGIQGTSCV